MKKKKDNIVKIKPTLVVVCDDVRMEENGKPFIFGIYIGDIRVKNPIENSKSGKRSIFLSLWVPFEVKEAGTANFEMKILSPDPKHVAKVKATMNFPVAPPPQELTAFTIGGIRIPVETSGELKILFKNDGDRGWKTLRTLPIIVE